MLALAEHAVGAQCCSSMHPWHTSPSFFTLAQQAQTPPGCLQLGIHHVNKARLYHVETSPTAGQLPASWDLPQSHPQNPPITYFTQTNSR